VYPRCLFRKEVSSDLVYIERLINNVLLCIPYLRHISCLLWYNLYQYFAVHKEDIPAHEENLSLTLHFRADIINDHDSAEEQGVDRIGGINKGAPVTSQRSQRTKWRYCRWLWGTHTGALSLSKQKAFSMKPTPQCPQSPQ